LHFTINNGVFVYLDYGGDFSDTVCLLRWLRYWTAQDGCLHALVLGLGMAAWEGFTLGYKGEQKKGNYLLKVRRII
jgi:hypothetical protein